MPCVLPPLADNLPDEFYLPAARDGLPAGYYRKLSSTITKTTVTLRPWHGPMPDAGGVHDQNNAAGGGDGGGDGGGGGGASWKDWLPSGAALKGLLVMLGMVMLWSIYVREQDLRAGLMPANAFEAFGRRVLAAKTEEQPAAQALPPPRRAARAT